MGIFTLIYRQFSSSQNAPKKHPPKDGGDNRPPVTESQEVPESNQNLAPTKCIKVKHTHLIAHLQARALCTTGNERGTAASGEQTHHYRETKRKVNTHTDSDLQSHYQISLDHFMRCRISSVLPGREHILWTPSCLQKPAIALIILWKTWRTLWVYMTHALLSSF